MSAADVAASCSLVVYEPATGEYVCLDNGVVFGDRITSTGSSRELDRVPIFYAHHDYGISTSLSVEPRGKSKVLFKSMRIMHRVADKVMMPGCVREEAARLLRDLVSREACIRPIHVCAVLYISCRNMGYCRSVDEFAGAVGVNRNTLARVCTRLAKKLGVRVERVDYRSLIVSIVSSVAEIPASVKGEVVKIAVNAYERARCLVSSWTKTLCAASVYYACRKLGLSVSARRIGKACGAHEDLVRVNYRKILRAMAILAKE